MGESLPQPLLQEAAAYRIDDLYYYYYYYYSLLAYSHVTLRHPFPFLLSCSPHSSLLLHHLCQPSSLFRLAPHVCRIFLRKIDRPSDCLSCRGSFTSCLSLFSVPSFTNLFSFLSQFYYLPTSCLLRLIERLRRSKIFLQLPVPLKRLIAGSLKFEGIYSDGYPWRVLLALFVLRLMVLLFSHVLDHDVIIHLVSPDREPQVYRRGFQFPPSFLLP